MIRTIEPGNIPAGVRQALARYLSDRSSARMVTMPDAIGNLRARYPALTASNRRLADVAVGQAIILGLDFELDGDGAASVDRWTSHRNG